MSVLEQKFTDRLPIPRVTRQFWVIAHRYIGLTILLFVFQVGFTGAIISFYEELDSLLLGDWANVTPAGTMLSEQDLIERVAVLYPNATIESETEYQNFPAKSAIYWLEPTVEGEVLQKDEVFVNPYNGQILGDRKWGGIRFDAAHFIPMMYRMHYSLLVQDWDGWGFWVMGIVGLLWAFDHIASLIVSIPRSGPFWKAMTVKWRGSAYRINFDFHRAGGLFLWVVMLMLALTGASWNATFFRTNVIHAAIDSVTETSPYALETVPDLAEPIAEAEFTREQTRALITAEMAALDYQVHEIWFEYADYKGVYDVWVKLDAGGTRWYQAAVDGKSGQIVARFDPKDRSIGDVINDWIYPLHTGQAFGLVGRTIICLTGVATCIFCVTGFVIWQKKFRARRKSKSRTSLLPN